jgi:hypothetical protein
MRFWPRLPDLDLRSWSAALRERDFAAIADWFMYYFFAVGATGSIAAGIAAAIEQGAAAGLSHGIQASKGVSTLAAITTAVGASVSVGFASGFRGFALSLLFAAASMVSGWLLGLLFGIPRTLSRTQSATAPAMSSSGQTASEKSGDAGANSGSRVNTNLEDISDWLTKMLVGVGLTQLYAVPGFLWTTAGKLNAHGLGWEQHGQLLVLALFFYFAPGGFWLSYVGTRTILTKLFDQVAGVDPREVLQAADPNKLRIDPSATGVVAGDAQLAQADRSLLNTPLQALTKPLQMGAWGAAQARAGNLSFARLALEDALRTEPNNSELKEQLAKVYTLLGNRTDAELLMRDSPATEIAVLNALYEPQPDGFSKAIKIGESLLNKPGMQRNVSLHVWLACAYGQQYGYEKEHGASDDRLNSIKEKALREIDAAIAIDPSAREFLRSLWKPSPGSEENDLASFDPEDEELKRRLG